MKPERKRAKWRQGLFMVLMILCSLSAFEFALADTKHAHHSDISTIEKGGTVPLPVAFTISSDDRLLWADTFMDGKVRVFDISDPFHPSQIYEEMIGSQVNMVSSSWDSRRLYFTSSLLSRWDKKGKDNEQFLKGYEWDGKGLRSRFAIDFTREKLGPPHEMKFGAYSLYSKSK